ncbi:hypothetical protein Aglo03_05510 [Actinokineospora globicatena]|uniref:Uncharacterized protein n=1 Tax=Actinokineospora globicatena TaxID=103729 RepID=A0A9W6V4Y5_9PSEU|nr:hypothetical protein Aglo03_05510 [Actinokineospora globicatena]
MDVDEPVRLVGGVQVEVQHTGQSAFPHVCGEGVRDRAGVAADQVVHRVPAARSPFDQRSLLQRGERLVRVRRGQGR